VLQDGGVETGTAREPLPQPAASFHTGHGDVLLKSSSKFLSHHPRVLKKNDESDSPNHQAGLITTEFLNNKMWSSFAFPIWSMSWYKSRFQGFCQTSGLEANLFFEINKV